MADYLKTIDPKTMPQSLVGASIKPLDPNSFNGTVWIPEKYFANGETPEEALTAYLDSFDE